MAHGVCWAFVMDGKGGAAPVASEDMMTPPAPQPPGFFWAHLDAVSAETRAWLEQKMALPPDIVAALVATQTRPRFEPIGDGGLINLRGVNHNPGAEPEDMVSVRIWAEPGRVISTRRTPLLALKDLYVECGRSRAPATPGELVSRIAMRLAERMEPVVLDLSERLDDLETALFEDGRNVTRADLAGPRSEAAQIRRYVAPQREALRALSVEPMPWLSHTDHRRFREATDAATRVTEELEEARERATILNDLIVDQRAERMNRNMLVLAVITGIFLPLNLLAGMLGMNVSGVPFADHAGGFWIVSGLVVAIGLAVTAIFRWMKWL